jgi:hypothetical protein
MNSMLDTVLWQPLNREYMDSALAICEEKWRHYVCRTDAVIQQLNIILCNFIHNASI